MSTIKGDHYPACATWFGEECDCDAWKEAPVRDIREAMHPAPFVTADKFLSEDARRRALAYVPSEPLTPEIGFYFGEADAAGVAMSPDCTHMLTRGSLVATLPDGSRVNLPAGTVLREGEEAIPEHPVIALVRSFVGKPGEGPEVNIEPLPPHLAALLAEHPRWSIADAERSIVDTTEGRDPPK